MLITGPHLHPDDHPRLRWVMWVLGDHRGRWLLLREGTGGLGWAGRRLALLLGSYCQGHSAWQTSPQLLVRANLPRTKAPGRHWEPEGFIGMGREQPLLSPEQRGVSQLGSGCFEGGWLINAFVRFLAVCFRCLLSVRSCCTLEQAVGVRQLRAGRGAAQARPRTGGSRAQEEAS